MSEAEEQKVSEQEFRAGITRTLLRIVYGSLLGSAAFLALAAYCAAGGALGEANWGHALSMMASRTFGIASFLCGAALLLLERWTAGTLTLIASIALPCISFALFGTI